MNNRKQTLIWILLTVICAALLGIICYRQWFCPTRILVVNALESQQADIIKNNNSKHITIDCIDTDNLDNAGKYDVVILYGRRLFLKPEQIEALKKAADNGTVVFTKSVRGSGMTINHNLTARQTTLLQKYFTNENRHNFQNGLICLRHIATPHRWGDQNYEDPVEILHNMYYHRQYGKYFKTAQQLTNYLKERKIYNKKGKNLALISGITFPMEGNREHIDTLITLLTQRGFNVYPMTCEGKKREKMLRELSPDAIVYLAMGRIGNDSLVSWLHEKNILLFTPYPISMSHEKWMTMEPLSNGTKNARVVIPEIDGGIAQYCIGTQEKTNEGYFIKKAETERCNSFVEYVYNHMQLRSKRNSEKHIAIGYFKRPGKDALLASGMEVIPSLYNFLKRLRKEGYDVSGLPSTLEKFAKEIKTEGIVLGSYATGTQQEYMRKGHPFWLKASQYESWVKEILPKEKYNEVVNRYGKAPGNLLSRGDSLAIACIRYGNILLFPQPRPALGDDDFKLAHGSEVAPPHSYIAPYLYVQKGFKADALIHFGTHGNLEFTPGREVAMRHSDWSEVLVGNLPHFYFYTTGNVGESIIAKRRSHAVLLTYLTPPYAESGMREKYNQLLSDVHKAISRPNDKPLARRIKQTIVKEGINRELNLDGNINKPYSKEELELIDAHLEELSNEKMQGAYYTLGIPYSQRDLLNTTLAIAADPLAYEAARKDRDNGKISTKQLQDYAFVAHKYLPTARRQIENAMRVPNSIPASSPLFNAVEYRKKLLLSTELEISNMIRALNGGSIAPVPGGDPIVNPVVLPTGRNMFSINPENTPDPQAWEDGKRLAEETLEKYKLQHGNYPQKVSYTFWAGEFINSQGATIAQALWMLGVEPIRDSQGRISDIKLVPTKTLGRPRINVVIQVSGQLRDIASSRLKLITNAVKMASTADEDDNYVRKGTISQEKSLIDKGMSPKQARELSTERVFGPANNGYSTGMMNYIERSGTWENSSELAEGYLNNMGAAYSDEEHWGTYTKGLFESALKETEVIIQPRQSNTWGPVSLDHVYEFTGGLSLTVKTITGKEPDAYMADYRNNQYRRLQEAKEAVAVEMRTTLLNPVFIRERMKGDEGTAQMFGEMFRNIFGWNATRPSSLDKNTFDDLYRIYIADENKLGIKDYFQKTNPAAFQAMTAVMLESARKGYWKPTRQQLNSTAKLHAETTRKSGAACTDFVCNNNKLQRFVSDQLDAKERKQYETDMANVKGIADGQKNTVLKEDSMKKSPTVNFSLNNILIPAIVIIAIIAVAVLVKRRKQ